MNPSGEPSESSTPEDTPLTRRRAILGVSGVAASALAGCLSLASSDGSETTTESSDLAAERSSDGPHGSETTTGSSDLPCFDSASSKAATPDQPLPTPVRGDPDSAVTVATYEDFGCPHCKEYVLDVVPKLKDQYIEPGKIRYEHHDFPIPVLRKQSYAAANAARAVQTIAGDDAFWVYAEHLFEHQDSIGKSLYASLANDICLDGSRVRSAGVNENYEQTVMSDRNQGIDRGVNETPTVFVNDEKLSGHSFDSISSAIEGAK